MTNENILWKNEPFLLKPAGKDYLWGGTRLNDDFGKDIDMEPLAETWECSTHPDGPSMVAGGEHEGKMLPQVLKEHPEYLGIHADPNGALPILIKFIDAQKDLSVQVHPNDEYARDHENGSWGKTEIWYVLDAAKDAELVYGFHHDMDKEVLRKSLQDGTVEKYLQKVPIHKDDVFYIEAGTVHAIGAGALIAEIQENSNLTYRLYDYNREDKFGNKRPLHIEKALEAANLKGSTRPRQPMRVLKYKRGCASEFLCRCKYFQVERLLLNTEQCRQMSTISTSPDSFQVLLCTTGCGVLYGTKEIINFYRGDCIFLPANSVSMRLHGRAQMLRISC